jgi:hypothetical protein
MFRGKGKINHKEKSMRYFNDSIFRLGALAALTAGLFGCLRPDRDRFDSDGLSAFVKEENENMGQVLSTTPGAPLAKNAAADTGLDTITGDYVLTPLHYEAACQCFVRKAELTLSTGFKREREDTIHLFLDSNSTLTDSLFRPWQAVIIAHKRHVRRTSAVGRQVDLHFRTDMRWGTLNGQQVGIWNGDFRGTYNTERYGELGRTATVTNLTRPFLGLGGPRLFGAPVAGTIHIDGLLFDYDIVIDGPGEATVTITRLRDGRQFVIHIDVNNQEREG